MARILSLVFLSLLISGNSFGQCINPPVVSLSSLNGTTCGTTTITISNNTFGGSAQNVTIASNGYGTLSQAATGRNPFDIIYTPSVMDAGNQVVITVRTNTPRDLQCTAAQATYRLTVNPSPPVPVLGIITQPDCVSSSGSVVLNGLPLTGLWTITRSPGLVTSNGSGNTTTVTGIAAGSYSFTLTNSSGCTSSETSVVKINPQPNVPQAPLTGTISNPTCLVSTGSVVLNGLPSAGNWTIKRTPGGVMIPGSGSSTTIANLSEGTYTCTVTNSDGCTSPSSGNIVIIAQPASPAPPVVGSITSPTCALSTGSVIMSGLPATGTWTLTRYPGGITSGGTGTSILLTGLTEGLYNYSLTNMAGCVSLLSADIVMPSQPKKPSPPVIGTITQPRFESPAGSVVLNGLPEAGSWTLTLLPGNLTTLGSGTTKTISGLASGTYYFTVTNSSGCSSASSADFVINALTGPPVVVITNPEVVCIPSTADLTAPGITAGSALNLAYTYWTDPTATISFNTPAAARSGTYYIKATALDGYFTIKPVIVTAYQVPLPDAGSDMVLTKLSGISMNAQLAHTYESGAWSLISGTGSFIDPKNPKTPVNGLSVGKNVFLWTVTNKACPPSYDSVVINVRDQITEAIQSLITPNMDGRNDYFILKSPETLSKIQLIVFDRRGVQVFKSDNYENSWNGVDYNGNPLPEDTYFYSLKRNTGSSASGFIVIRR